MSRGTLYPDLSCSTTKKQLIVLCVFPYTTGPSSLESQCPACTTTGCWCSTWRWPSTGSSTHPLTSQGWSYVYMLNIGISYFKQHKYWLVTFILLFVLILSTFCCCYFCPFIYFLYCQGVLIKKYLQKK